MSSSALAAAGAGIGGLYVTLYAASRGYHLLDAGFVWAGVVLAAGLAVGLALAWSSSCWRRSDSSPSSWRRPSSRGS